MIWRRVLFWIVLIVTISAFPIFFFLLKQSNELGSKPEYSFLQAIAVQDRNAPAEGGLIIKRHNRYCAVGIPAADGKDRVWVLLNPKYRPYEKEMPSGEDYRISRDNLDSLKKQCKITDPVVHLLESHLKQE